LTGKDYFCKEARNHIIHRVFPEEEHPRLIVANTGFSSREIEIIRLICQKKQPARSAFRSTSPKGQWNNTVATSPNGSAPAMWPASSALHYRIILLTWETCKNYI
jgi:hypothetical protein